jgi:hypothetical protein
VDPDHPGSRGDRRRGLGGASAFSDGNVGIVVVAVLAAALAAVLWVLANRTPVHARDLDRTTVPVHA